MDRQGPEEPFKEELAGGGRCASYLSFRESSRTPSNTKLDDKNGSGDRWKSPKTDEKDQAKFPRAVESVLVYMRKPKMTPEENQGYNSQQQKHPDRNHRKASEEEDADEDGETYYYRQDGRKVLGRWSGEEAEAAHGYGTDPDCGYQPGINRKKATGRKVHNKVAMGNRHGRRPLHSSASAGTNQVGPKVPPILEIMGTRYRSHGGKEFPLPPEDQRTYECAFCKGNESPTVIFQDHAVRTNGKVSCPHLRQHVCKICHATGDVAHTMKYCPYNPIGMSGKHPVYGYGTLLPPAHRARSMPMLFGSGYVFEATGPARHEDGGEWTNESEGLEEKAWILFQRFYRCPKKFRRPTRH